MLRSPAEPADGPQEVALIGQAYDGRDEKLVGENRASGGQHRHVQFSALGHASGSSITAGR